MRQEPLVSNSPGAVRTIGPTNMKIATTKMIFNISEKKLARDYDDCYKNGCYRDVKLMCKRDSYVYSI